MLQWTNSTWTNTRNMTLITASEARRRTISREQQIALHLERWTEKFNGQVNSMAAGSPSKESATGIFFEIAAANDLMHSAKEMFISQVREAGFKVSMHDANDENDYFVYWVDWAEQK